MISVVSKCPYVCTKIDWKKYYSFLSKNFRQDIRTQYNRIMNNGLTHSFSSKEKDIDDIFLNSLIEMHLNGIAGKNKISFLQTENGREFLKEIICEFGKLGWVRLNVMNINDEEAAYVLGFEYGNKLYYWNTGKSNKYDNFSPGKLLLHHMLKETFFNNHLEEFDLLRGEEDYKYRWTNLQRKNYQVNVISNSVYIRVVFKMHGLYHARIKEVDQYTGT